MSKISRVLESLFSALSDVFQESSTSFVEVETVDTDATSLVGSDGSLATVIKVKGSFRLVGQDEYDDSVSRLSTYLDPMFKNVGHSLQVYWIRDPEASHELVRRFLEPSRQQAEQLNLDFKDLFDERQKELVKWVSSEEVYFVCWTHPSVLTPIELKSGLAQQKKEGKVFDGMNFSDAQSPRRLLSALRNKHAAFSTSLVNELKEMGLLSEVLKGHDAVKAMRNSVDPQWTPSNWRAILPGDKLSPKFPVRAEEMSAVWWPPLASQVWPRDAESIEGRFVRIGDRIHAPMYVETQPGRIQDFQELIKKTMNLDPKMPWTVSFMMGGAGLRKQGLKETMSSVVQVMNSDNPYILKAIRELKDFSKKGAVVNFQVCFNTWVEGTTPEKLDLLRQRAARLSRAFIDWGGAQTREVTGDPVEGFTSTAMGLTYKSVGAESAAPLIDVIPMLPITQPGSPWSTGSEFFTSPKGKMMPFQPGSSLQNTWIGLYLGGPGSGKSMQMFKQHLATCVAAQPGVTTLPYISIIDIGPSASGLVSLLKNALPPKLRKYVNHYRIRNTADYRINMFDLQLGRDSPLPEERAMLINQITMIATSAETGKASDGTSELVGLCIDYAYDVLKDNDLGTPHLYSPNTDTQVDAALDEAGIRVERGISWYGVRDLLFRAGRTHDATIAARYAYPTLEDMAAAARSNLVMDMYENKKVDSESLPEAFSRMIQSACREYPVLNGATKFDIGESRITIFDLDEVAKGGGPAGSKQVSVMYGMAMYVLTRNFLLTKENLNDFTPEYRNYHHPRVMGNLKELKTICCDEFHRLGQGFSDTLRERIKIFGREGRKWKIQVMLSSQQLKDFDKDMIELATAIYIMDRPDEGIIKDYVERFGFTETEQHALKYGIQGPRAGGATFFVRMKLKEGGYYNQLLRNPAGPVELWAGSTTSEDCSIRDAVYISLGPAEGRMALGVAYPSGSAFKEFELRRDALVLSGGSGLGEISQDLLKVMTQEVIDSYRKTRDEALREEMVRRQFLEDNE